MEFVVRYSRGQRETQNAWQYGAYDNTGTMQRLREREYAISRGQTRSNWLAGRYSRDIRISAREIRP